MLWLDRHSEDIFATGVRWHDAGDPVALAVVVGLEGSGYRKPGARLLVGKGGNFTGLVSGGCLEQDIIDAAARVQQSGKAEMLEFDTRPEDDILLGWGSGCRGLFHILLHRCEGNLLRVLHEELEAGRTVVLGTVVGTSDEFSELGAQVLLLEDGALVGDSTIEPCLRLFAAKLPSRPQIVAIDSPDKMRVAEGYAYDGREAAVGAVLVETMRPAPRLLVIGAGDDVPPVVDVATTAGLRTTVLDHRPSFADRSRFPTADEVLVRRPEDVTDETLHLHSAVVVMTHQFEWDQRWLARLSSVPFAYIGVLGPLDRTRRLFARSEQPGMAEQETGSAEAIAALSERDVYGPVGLDIGGEGPGPIAVSIVAQVLAVLHGRDGGHFRDNYEGNKRNEKQASVRIGEVVAD